MILLLLSSAMADPSGSLARPGEALGLGVVETVEGHPEYERYGVRQPDGGVAVFEITTGEGGLCDVAGVTLFPRPDLGAAGSAGAAELCERLRAHPVALRSRLGPNGAGSTSEGPTSEGPTSEGPTSEGPTSGPAPAPADDARSPGPEALGDLPRMGPLHAVLAALLALCLWRARPTRQAVAVGAFAVFVRLIASPWGAGNGNLAGYEKLLMARGGSAHAPYGDGWGVLHGLVPGWPDSVFALDLGLGALSAALLSVLAGGGAAGLAAGMFLALLPAHVGVSASETMLVPVLALQLVGACGALAFARRGHPADGAIGALAVGFAAFVRPEALLFAPVPVAAVALSRTRPALRMWAGPALLLVGLLAWRIGTLGSAPPMGAGTLLQVPGPAVLLPRFGAPERSGGFFTFLHAGLTPPALWGLAAVGAAVLWRTRRRASLVLAAWVLLTNLPLSAKVFPIVDAVRLQLCGQAPWLLLAGVGAARLPRWVGVLALVSFLPYFPIRPWVQAEEWAFLREVVPALPATGTVRYDARPQRARSFAAVMEAMGPARWSASSGTLRYIGLDCRGRADPGEACDTSNCVAERVTRLEGRVDLDLTLRDRTIGFWRCP